MLKKGSRFDLPLVEEFEAKSHLCMDMESERLNSPDTSAILFDILGHQLQFTQDPNSKHLGTTVWDASMVFAKFLEKNNRKGKFSASKLKSKRAIELGAGCGVAGFSMALLGCDVVTTDQTEVLPLLMRNVVRNTSRIMQANADSDFFGSIQVAELNWGNMDHVKAVVPPFDYIIGTDVVYAEHLLEPLLQTMLALSGPKTTIVLGYEIRSTNVHELMLNLWKRYFEVKIVPRGKMDSKYQHPSIQLFIMRLKHFEGFIDIISHGINSQIDEIETNNTTIDARSLENKDGDDNSDGVEEKEVSFCDKDDVLVSSIQNGKLNEWEARRVGSMAARLLRDVKLG